MLLLMALPFILIGSIVFAFYRLPIWARLVAAIGSAIIVMAFLIPTVIGTCTIQGATFCTNATAQFFASIRDLIGFSLMLGFPIVLYVALLTVALAELIRPLILGFVSARRKSGLFKCFSQHKTAQILIVLLLALVGCGIIYRSKILLYANTPISLWSCAEIQNATLHAQCLGQIAVEKDDPSVCPQNSQPCLAFYADKPGSPKGCQGIEALETSSQTHFRSRCFGNETPIARGRLPIKSI